MATCLEAVIRVVAARPFSVPDLFIFEYAKVKYLSLKRINWLNHWGITTSV